MRVEWQVGSEPNANTNRISNRISLKANDNSIFIRNLLTKE
jgi:hypothetical protein